MNKNLKIFFIILGTLIVSFLIGLYVVRQQENKFLKLEGEYSVLSRNYKNRLDSVNYYKIMRKAEKDSLYIIIQNKENLNKELAQRNEILDKKITYIQNKEIVIPTTTNGLTDYYNKRYSVTDNVVIEERVGLTYQTAYNASYELEEKDKLSQVLELKNSQISNNIELIGNLEDNIGNFKTMLSSAEKEIAQREQLQISADKNIKTLEKEVKILSKNSKINKFLIPTAAVLGGFIGYKIAK